MTSFFNQKEMFGNKNRVHDFFLLTLIILLFNHYYLFSNIFNLFTAKVTGREGGFKLK